METRRQEREVVQTSPCRPQLSIKQNKIFSPPRRANKAVLKTHLDAENGYLSTLVYSHGILRFQSVNSWVDFSLNYLKLYLKERKIQQPYQLRGFLYWLQVQSSVPDRITVVSFLWNMSADLLAFQEHVKAVTRNYIVKPRPGKCFDTIFRVSVNSILIWVDLQFIALCKV